MPPAPFSEANFSTQFDRFAILFGKAQSLMLLGKFVAALSNVDSARTCAVPSTESGSVELDELEAEIRLLQNGEAPHRLSESGLLQRLDASYRFFLDRQRLQDAVQNRAKAAGLAHRIGRLDLFRDYSCQTIELAKAHDLEYLEIDARIRRYQFLLMDDLSGETVNELRGELHDKEGTMCSELAGSLSETLERYASGADAVYNRVLAGLSQPPLPLEALKLAAQKATAFSLVSFAQALTELQTRDSVQASPEIHTAIEAARGETRNRSDGLRVELFLLVATLMRKRKSIDMARMLCVNAAQLAAAHPQKLSRVEQELADIYEIQGKTAKALEHAQKAVDAAKGAKIPVLVSQVEEKLNSLRARVLYFSCHGTVSGNSLDLLGASQLRLAEDTLLTAREVSTWKLSADLVFLNACQSGRFRLGEHSDVNGFVRAFLMAGAKSIIAPVIHVTPQPAGEFAADFFQAWLSGGGVAEALQSAQFAARKRLPDSMEWAAYCLTGGCFITGRIKEPLASTHHIFPSLLPI